MIIMNSGAERFNGLMAMLGIVAGIGAYATINGDLMRLSAMVGSPHNNEIIRVNLEGHKDSAIAIATQAAHDLIAKGALQLLNT